MKRMRNDNKKLGLENVAIRELKASDIAQADGGSLSLIPISDPGLEEPISGPIGPPEGGVGSELNC
jgi:hypothetical protein